MNFDWQERQTVIPGHIQWYLDIPMGAATLCLRAEPTGSKACCSVVLKRADVYTADVSRGQMRDIPSAKRFAESIAMLVSKSVWETMKNSTVDWAVEEHKVIADMAKKQELSPEGVLRQALRTYQLIVDFGWNLIDPIQKDEDSEGTPTLADIGLMPRQQLIECLTGEFQRLFPKYPPTDPQNMIQLISAELTQARAKSTTPSITANWSEPKPCPYGDHLVFVRRNGRIVAHYNSGGAQKCPGSNMVYPKS